MCLLHKWARWKQYEIKIPARRLTKNYSLCEALETRQTTHCIKCGKSKDELVKMTVLS